jgi:hypothetical protein
MSKKEIGSISQIARELLNHLPKAMDDELRILIARAEKGQDTTVEIIDLFSQHETTRRWIKEQINLQSREKSATSRHSPLAGNPSLVLPSQKWICPESTCDHWMFIIQAGGDPPTCEKHKVKMVCAE